MPDAAWLCCSGQGWFLSSDVEAAMRTLLRAGAVVLLAVVSVLAMNQSGAFAQAAAECFERSHAQALQLGQKIGAEGQLIGILRGTAKRSEDAV